MRGNSEGRRAQSEEASHAAAQFVLVVALGLALFCARGLGAPDWVIEYGESFISAVADDDD